MMMKSVRWAITFVSLLDIFGHCEFDFWPYSPFEVLVLRLLIVVCNFALLLVVLFNTYPIQVGLFDIVAIQARPVLVVHLIYIAITMWISAKYSEYLGLTKGKMMEFWVSPQYTDLLWVLVLHKVTALFYYLLTYRSCLEFMGPKYTDKAAWVVIAQDRFNLHPLPKSKPRSVIA